MKKKILQILMALAVILSVNIASCFKAYAGTVESLAAINSGTETFADFSIAGVVGAVEAYKSCTGGGICYDGFIASARANKGSDLNLNEVQYQVDIVNSMRKTVDDLLNDAKARAASLMETQYTAESWNYLVAALTLPETNNAEKWAKIDAINNSISSLVPVGNPTQGSVNANEIVQKYKVTSKYAPSSTNTTPTIAEPVNSVLGNYLQQAKDVSIANTGLPIDFERTYNSKSEENGLLGHRWMSTYSNRLDLYSDGAIFVDSDGRWDMYKLDGDGQYIPQAGVLNKLAKQPDSTFIITKINQDTYHFSDSGKLLSISDANGNTLTLSYNADGALQKISGSHERTLEISTDDKKRITSITDPANHKFSYEYNPDGDLTSVTNPLGEKNIFEYDANHNLTSITNPNGHKVVINEYDSEDRVIRQTDGRGNTGTFQYYPSQKITVFTDSLGKTTKYSYDDQNRVVKQTDPLGKESLYSFDDNDQLTQKTDKNGNATKFEYDSDNNLIKITDAAGSVQTISYDEKHHPLSLTDPRESKTAISYDNRGNVKKIVDALNGETVIEHDEHGLPTSVQNPEAGKTIYSYDQYGDLTSIKDPVEGVTEYSYDSLGNVVSIKDATGRISRLDYDPLSRIVKTTDPSGNATQFQYDGVNNVLKMTDAKGNETTYDYDEDSNLVQVQDALGEKTRYAYDLLNRLYSINDAKNNKTNYAYDALGQIKEETDALGNKNSYDYDNQGNIVKSTNAEGKTINYSYDSLNRLVKKTYSDGTQANFSYDNSGNLTSAENQQVTYTYEYDPLNRISKFTDSRFGSLRYTYNKIGERTSVTDDYNNGNSYQYDKAGRLLKLVEGGDGNYDFSCDAAGRRTSLLFPNGMATKYGYNKIGRINDISTTNSKNNNISNRTYSYDQIGNWTAQKDGQWSIKYDYDKLSQLVRTGISRSSSKAEPEDATYPKPGFSFPLEKYGYDKVGNRTQGPNSENYQYNAANELMNISSKNPLEKATFDFDKNGNVIQKKEKGSVWKFNYDGENRMTEASQLGMGNKQIMSVHYSYDPFGRRIAKNSQGNADHGNKFWPFQNSSDKQIEQYLYDGEDIFSTYDESKNLISHFVQGPEIDEPLSIINYDKSGKGKQKISTNYYLSDAIGSIIGLADEKGRIIERYYYDSFGKLLFPESRINQPYAFTGREYDLETGLYFYRARYYDADTGRFIQKDQVAGLITMPQSLNRYLYVMNRPNIFTDPYGRWYKEVLTGKQSFSDFKLEVGQAAEQLSQDSKAWDYAISNPIKTGAVVGVVGGTAAGAVSTGIAVAPAAGTIEYTAIEKFIALNTATGGALTWDLFKGIYDRVNDSWTIGQEFGNPTFKTANYKK